MNRSPTGADPVLHSAVPEHPDPIPPHRTAARADRLWQRGIVVRDAAGHAWLELPDPSLCERCRRGEGCGSATFLGLFRRGWNRAPGADRVRLPLPADEAARFQDGAPVCAGIGGRWLVIAALRLYLAPLASFLAGLWLGATLFPGQEPVALALALGAGAGVMLLAGRGASAPRLTLMADAPGPRAGLESAPARCHLPNNGADCAKPTAPNQPRQTRRARPGDE